jgi:hypothetical protein
VGPVANFQIGASFINLTRILDRTKIIKDDISNINPFGLGEIGEIFSINSISKLYFFEFNKISFAYLLPNITMELSILFEFILIGYCLLVFSTSMLCISEGNQ